MPIMIYKNIFPFYLSIPPSFEKINVYQYITTSGNPNPYVIAFLTKIYFKIKPLEYLPHIA